MPSGLIRIAAAVALASCLVLPSSAQDKEPEEKPDKKAERYTTRRVHDLNGIGKFYMGREIAHVMGHQAIDWLERPQREEEERLTLLMDALSLKPGMQVADIGTGSGVISVMIARRIGDGKVFAVDIQQEMLDAVEEKCRVQQVTNVVPVLGTTQSPKLAAGSIDLAVMVDVYHEFDFPYEMLKEIAVSLKPGGRVAFVEYRKEDPKVPIKLVHKMTEKQVRREAELPDLGLTWEKTVATLPRQHVIIFQKAPAAAGG